MPLAIVKERATLCRHLAGLLLSMLLGAFSAGARSDGGMHCWLARYLEKRSKFKKIKKDKQGGLVVGVIIILITAKQCMFCLIDLTL